MKCRSRFLFAICLVLPFSPPSIIASGNPARYTQLQLSSLISSADIIVVGSSSIRGVFGDIALRDLHVSSVLLQRDEDLSLSNTNRFVLITPKISRVVDSPTVVSGKRYIMFLRRVELGKELTEKADLGPSSVLCEFLEGWQSCLSLDFEGQQLSVRLFRDAYDIETAKDVIEVTKNLSAWRRMDTKEQQLNQLFSLWQSKGSEKVYAENIREMIEKLGGRIAIENGVDVLIRATGVRVPTSPGHSPERTTNSDS